MIDPGVSKFIRSWVLGFAGFIALLILWPFYPVPTGSRGVVTQFGRIIRIENEGLAILPPWQGRTNFSVRADATI